MWGPGRTCKCDIHVSLSAGLWQALSSLLSGLNAAKTGGCAWTVLLCDALARPESSCASRPRNRRAWGGGKSAGRRPQWRPSCRACACWGGGQVSCTCAARMGRSGFRFRRAKDFACSKARHASVRRGKGCGAAHGACPGAAVSSVLGWCSASQARRPAPPPLAWRRLRRPLHSVPCGGRPGLWRAEDSVEQGGPLRKGGCRQLSVRQVRVIR